jgi:hypothetical protein
VRLRDTNFCDLQSNKLYFENTLLRIAGALFCHDPKRAAAHTDQIEATRTSLKDTFDIEAQARAYAVSFNGSLRDIIIMSKTEMAGVIDAKNPVRHHQHTGGGGTSVLRPKTGLSLEVQRVAFQSARPGHPITGVVDRPAAGRD